MSFLRRCFGWAERPSPAKRHIGTKAMDVEFDCVNGRYTKHFEGDAYWCRFSDRLVENKPEDFLAAFMKNWIRDGYALLGKDVVLIKDLRGAKIVNGPYNSGLKVIEEKPG